MIFPSGCPRQYCYDAYKVADEEISLNADNLSTQSVSTGRRALATFVSLVFSVIVLVSPVRSTAQDLERLIPFFNMQVPMGSGPFPAVILLSGGQGFGPHYDGPQTQLSTLGFVVLRVDYIRSRGKKNSSEVFLMDGALDVKAVAEYLKTQPFIKRTSVNLLGWSAGGAVALKSLSQSVLAPVDAVVAYYPNCRIIDSWESYAPVLILFGDGDRIVPLEKCEAAASTVSDPDLVDFRVYPNTDHAFDFKAHPNYNRRAAIKSWAAVVNFLKR